MHKSNRQLIYNSSIQRLTEKENLRQSETSDLETIQGLRHTQSIVLSRNTFNFEEINTKTGQQTSQRIHGKMGTKRTGGKVVLVGQKQKIERKQTNVSKIGKKQKSHIENEGKNNIKEESKVPSGLSIKAYEFDEKTNNYEQQDKLDQSLCSSQKHSKSSFLASAPITPKPREQQDLFKELKRKMMAENELFKNKKHKQNCFYATLKRKLKLQMMKIEEKQDYDRLNFTIEGCNANMHAKTSPRLLSANQQQRPQTAVNGSKVETQIGNIKQRPLSERARTYYSLQKSRKLNDLKKKSTQMLSPNRSERRTTNARLSHSRNSSQNTITQSCQDTLSKRDRHSRNQSDDYLKMNKILGDCDEYSSGQQFLKDNLKIFQFYCKKVDARFERVSHQLDMVQNFQIE